MAKAYFIVFVLIVGVFSHRAVGQRESKEELDRPFVEAEKRDALLIAKAFTRRLQETQDIGPLLAEFMAPDFLENAQRNYHFNSFVFQDEKVISKVPMALQREYFIEVTNFAVLTILYQFSFDPPITHGGGLKHPEEVKSIIEKYYKDGDPPARQIKSVKDVSAATRDFSKVNAVLRPSVSRFRSLSPDEFLLSLQGEKPFGEFYRVEVTLCEDKRQCSGLPLKSRIFGITVPFGFLEIGEFNRKMKVIGFSMFSGD